MPDGHPVIADDRCLRADLRSLETHVAAFQTGTRKRIATLREEMHRLRQDIDAENTLRLRCEGALSQHVASVDLGLKKLFECEKRERQESLERMLGIFAGRTSTLKEEIFREGNLASELEHILKRYLDVEVPKFHRCLQESSRNREVVVQRGMSRVSDGIAELQNALRVEVKARNDTEEALLQMCSEVAERMSAELALERQLRETSEDAFLNLLEEVKRRICGDIPSCAWPTAVQSLP